MEYFRYHGVNCFFLRSSLGERMMAVDAGWPCSLREYQRHLKEIHRSFEQIAWAIVTHFHMDHAGLLGEFLEAGIECFVFENQMDGIVEMERMIAKSHGDYRAIDRERLTRVSTSDSRKLFEDLGIPGIAIVTEAHSSDSISIVTDAHEALIGDLVPLDQTMDEDVKGLESWERIRKAGGRYIYPSHAAAFDLGAS